MVADAQKEIFLEFRRSLLTQIAEREKTLPCGDLDKDKVRRNMIALVRKIETFYGLSRAA